MIAGSAWWSAVALLAASVSVHGQDIAVQLRFDGKPLQTTTPPDFSCRDDNSKMWIGCRITPEPATGTYVLTRPAPGTYTLHVAIDENQDNPARFPGDYDVFQQFAVTSDMPVVLNVDMPKLSTRHSLGQQHQPRGNVDPSVVREDGHRNAPALADAHGEHQLQMGRGRARRELPIHDL